ncbi:unnamed protein product [Rotaria socialis]|uniref:Homeobox domain-containing protein n=1 Tax=Rotaria socialis TaxID=392032 RepID=A0A818SKV9_9BILA|nr:unnamed protein product [Rotaria socialis]CAF4847666.1 unnamed protein product [Rotaria socialis]
MSSSKKNSRQPLNTRQRSILIMFYEQNPYPSTIERQQLVQMTGRTLKQIQDWFSNRRRNDPILVSGKLVYTSLPPPPPPPPLSSLSMPPIYYYTPAAPPSTSNVCPCCYLAQSSPINDHSIYSPCATFYYPSSNHTFHS